MVEVVDDPTAGWRTDLARVARVVSAGTVAGALAGFLVGGIGGRLVMLVLRLTSSDTLRGVETDDGFDIGVVSAGTFFLLLVTTVLGAVGGIAYLGVRSVVPAGARWPAAAALAGLVGGAAILKEEGIDFRLLDPLWFAVVAFIALPAAYGALVSVRVERRLATPWRSERSSLLALLPLVALLLAGGIGIVIVVLVFAGLALARTRPDIYARLRSPVFVWAGRAVLVAIAAVALVELVDDVGAIL